jgi:hypothetical protein
MESIFRVICHKKELMDVLAFSTHEAGLGQILHDFASGGKHWRCRY